MQGREGVVVGGGRGWPSPQHDRNVWRHRGVGISYVYEDYVLGFLNFFFFSFSFLFFFPSLGPLSFIRYFEASPSRSKQVDWFIHELSWVLIFRCPSRRQRPLARCDNPDPDPNTQRVSSPYFRFGGVVGLSTRIWLVVAMQWRDKRKGLTCGSLTIDEQTSYVAEMCWLQNKTQNMLQQIKVEG